jgi:hypothetical protein
MADDSIVERLMARNDPGVYRVSMPDGGEAYTGPTVKRALKAVGARAMTMDNSVFVDEDFDAANPDDQALYAHEVHHQMESGGTDDHGAHDAEEVAARAIERMVLHRSAQGDDFGEIMRDVRSGDVHRSAESNVVHRTESSGGASSEDSGDDKDPMNAYQAMLGQGKSHEAIVRELRDYVLKSLDAVALDSAFRSGPGDFI